MYIEKIFVSSRKKCNFSSLSNELILINNEKNLPNEYLLILRINKFPLVDIPISIQHHQKGMIVINHPLQRLIRFEAYGILFLLTGIFGALITLEPMIQSLILMSPPLF
jgi:hypothetical protein